MRHKNLKVITVLLFYIGLSGLNAQNTIPASGGNAAGVGGTVSYSVGQTVYTTNTGTNGILSQGVQQPFEIIIITNSEEAKDISLEIVVYPNPTTDFIVLKIKNYEIGGLRFQLYNINGSELQNNKIETKETNIPMHDLLPATYFLRVIDRNRVIKTFKIIKN